jgi:hypothetical protein
VSEQRITYDALLEFITTECREQLEMLDDRILVGPLASAFQTWMPEPQELMPSVDGFEIAHGLLVDL